MIYIRTLFTVSLVVAFIASCIYAHGHANEFELVIESQRLQIEFLRKSLAGLMCKGQEEILQTGVWCLQEDPRDNSNKHFQQELGRPLGKGHVTADYELSLFLKFFFSGFRVLELGAGSGQYGVVFNRTESGLLGVNLRPFDGSLNAPDFTNGAVQWADLTLPFHPIGGKADWVFSLEVAEHIPPQYEKQYLSNLDHNNICGAVISWAKVGQGGKGHVNEKNLDEVVSLLKSMGYEYQSKLSGYVRSRANYHWFRNTFMIFYNMKNFNSSSSMCIGKDNLKRKELLAPYFTAAGISQDEVEQSNRTLLRFRRR